MPEKQFFQTPDTVLATTVAYHGYLIDHCERDARSSVLFCFKRDRAIEKLLLKFAEGKVAVEPRRWHSHYKKTIKRMHDYEQSYASVGMTNPWS